jgi:glutathione S-transferase
MRNIPVLYSFRRCPYAMRARLAIAESRTTVELREVILRDKPTHMLFLSQKGTVPVLWLPDDKVIEESFDIMNWALSRNDPNGLLKSSEHNSLIERIDTNFKYHLDRYKYSSRYPETHAIQHRQHALLILSEIETILDDNWLNGKNPGFVDLAILPFIRQYRIADIKWFDACTEIPKVQAWLANFLAWNGFQKIMKKYSQWEDGTPGVLFGGEAELKSHLN